ncbi:MAG: hypothetical protein AABW72_02225 [archaeon]
MNFTKNHLVLVLIAIMLIYGVYLYLQKPAGQEEQVIGDDEGFQVYNPIMISITGFLEEQAKECGEYFCFKIYVTGSIDESLNEKSVTIKTNQFLELNDKLPLTINAEKKGSEYYADSFSISQVNILDVMPK